MTSRLAVKTLTASDLTFFEHHFRTLGAGNQKAVNLNRNVFVDQLYPRAPEVGATLGGRILVDLLLLGPGLAPAYTLARKIVKHGTYKNWRLNGEFVYSPEGDPDRFNVLAPGDQAVFEFDGEPIPRTVRAVLLARALEQDHNLVLELERLVSGRGMLAIQVSDLERAVSAASPAAEHPIRTLLLEEEIEEAALGGFAGLEKLRRAASRRPVTTAELQSARANAERIGLAGEELVFAHLSAAAERGELLEVVWEAQKNAISPFDFTVKTSTGAIVRIEVKSTVGSFERRFHVSQAELIAMAEDEVPTQLWRVYALQSGHARARIAADTRSTACRIVATLSELPSGVSADTLSVDPALYAFGEELRLEEAQSPEE